METNTSAGSEEEDVPPQKAARLFAGYKRSRHKGNRMNTSVASQARSQGGCAGCVRTPPPPPPQAQATPKKGLN